ncbi:putative tryptophan leader peptide [Actinomyces naeslundii str. Howell 279]|uniref:Putative tryptophan leader peptide n=1 Tax=Actinomyces naeslundii (strain ATCC 12104 / DSM 43013 / CCUG 2238 / JCM 8349 / NCTC 10301 / Howell 279) TaxID=1115803 RepID=J3JII7_ACTNH|nr:putative tryptophan leader peptide [Actinomyces naeslundii str. Howell 279]
MHGTRPGRRRLDRAWTGHCGRTG